MKKKVALLMLIIALVVGLRFSPAGRAFTFGNLMQNRQALLALVHDHAGLSVLVFIAVYIATAALSLPGAAVLTLAGGFLFGALPATVYVNIGATAGAVLAFLVARHLLGNSLQEKYRQQLDIFNGEMNKNGARYLLTLRLIPVFPFFLINFLSGLTTVPLGTFAWTTALGIVPATAVFAYAGRQLGSINALSEVLSPRIIAAFVILAAFALVPTLYQRFKKRKRDAF